MSVIFDMFELAELQYIFARTYKRREMQRINVYVSYYSLHAKELFNLSENEMTFWPRETASCKLHVVLNPRTKRKGLTLVTLMSSRYHYTFCAFVT